MPCYHPIQAWRSRHLNDAGKRPLLFVKRDGYVDMPVTIPCGRCIGCRLEYSRQWAVRCVHEASMYDRNCFITLTFRDTPLSLVKSDFVKFMKRLRANFGPGIRFLHCGEYGSRLDRPHHHACLFNFDFVDKYQYTVRGQVPLFRSDSLERLWPYGFSTVGAVSFDSAAYVARYIAKKITGSCADAHYEGRQPEYLTMSRRPGIGKPWLDKFGADVKRIDSVIINSLTLRPPKYYDSLYDDVALKRLKFHRRSEVLEETPDRIHAREISRLLQYASLKRQLMED